MRKYLATLHRRPVHHKKRFALLVSGGFTLFIFAIWSAVNFPPGTDPVKSPISDHGAREVSPLESLRSGVATSLTALKESFEELKNGVLNTYVQ
ncbi:MAG: hypothetical protein HYT69_00985 [Candidatus Zambryskibacteria bacterium]|nr:hypothetical protein [Candidatus Zambryskibacteria bacterium]